MTPPRFLSHAQDQVRLGEVLNRKEKFDEAVGVLQEATFVLEQLTIRYPDDTEFPGSARAGRMVSRQSAAEERGAS